jgi:hypothetical protein
MQEMLWFILDAEIPARPLSDYLLVMTLVDWPQESKNMIPSNAPEVDSVLRGAKPSGGCLGI